jgi:PIN domain nuclease of toxin-antitoxin system
MHAEPGEEAGDGADCYILDSFALLAHFQEKRGSSRVIELLEQAKHGNCRLLLSLGNLGEICCLVERPSSLHDVHRTLAAIDSLPIEILPADRDAMLAAAHLKANYPIAFAVAFAAAQSQEGVLLTGDPEFSVLAGIIQIEWLAR